MPSLMTATLQTTTIMNPSITTAATLADAIAEALAATPAEWLTLPLCECPQIDWFDSWAHSADDCSARVSINNRNAWNTTVAAYVTALVECEFTFDGEIYETREALNAALAA